MALEFSNTNALGENINVLVYGRLSVGKTALIASCPKPIIISSERGEITLKKYKVNIPILRVKTLQDLNEAYDYVESKAKKYRTVCIDSVTDIAESILPTILKENNNDGRRAYPQLTSGMSEVIRKFRDTELNTFMIANAVLFENEAGITSVKASMPGAALTRFLGHAFDVVLYMGINDEDEDENKHYRYLQTFLSSTVDAKDRTGNLNRFERPNMKTIFKKLKK